MAKRKAAAQPARDADVAALYAGDLQGFTGRRNALAKQLVEEGETEAAESVRSLRKPTAPAWALNQLSRREPKLRDRLLEAGTALRDAQARLVEGRAGADRARRAGEGERAVVTELVEATQRLATGEDAPLSSAAVERVRQTLHAVALDAEVRRQFGLGRLSEDHQAVGLGPVPSSARAAGARSKRSANQADKRTRAELEAAESSERDARRRLTAAEREVERATRQADRAQQALQSTTDALEEARGAAESASARVKELRKRVPRT